MCVVGNQALKEGREPDHSDYKQFKLTCENVGFQMLQKMGWKEGEGLGSEGQGIKNPVNKWVLVTYKNVSVESDEKIQTSTSMVADSRVAETYRPIQGTPNCLFARVPTDLESQVINL